MKNCSKCNIEKEVTEFYLDTKTKRPESKCKKCRASSKARWYKKNKHHELFAAKYRNAKVTAKRRNLEWNIPKEKWTELTNKGCYYCDNKVNPEDRTGLDRIDNAKGYLEDNILPACKSCNVGRNANFSVEEWLIAVKAILASRNLEG